jgi:Putative neutral zinc metallopeptidase
MRSLFRLLALATTISSAIAPSIARELSTQEAVHALAEALTYAGEQTFNKDGRFPSPQILFGIGGTFAYGSCQSASGSTIIPGSFYCPKTNTIILEYSQLEALRTRFGDGAVVYALAHEYAHYIQTVFGIKNSITLQELQADCMAGAILASARKTLGLDQRDILEVVSAAASIGGGSHGTSEQRSGAVMFGLEKGDISACSTNKPSAAPTQPTASPKPAPKTKPVAIRPKQTGIPHPGGNATYIGTYQLWIANQMVPIYKDNALSPKQGGTMTVKTYNDYTGKWQSFVTHVDCKSARFSFFPDLPTSQYSFQADAKMLAVARCDR